MDTGGQRSDENLPIDNLSLNGYYFRKRCFEMVKVRGEGLVVYDQLQSEHSRGKFLVRQERKYNFELCRVKTVGVVLQQQFVVKVARSAFGVGPGREFCAWSVMSFRSLTILKLAIACFAENAHALVR